MLVDIVVDANVLMHAQNPSCGRMQESLEFVSLLKDGTTLLCVDEGFSADEAANRSHIYSEYLRILRAGTVGYMIVVHLLRSGRFAVVPSSLPKQTRDAVQKQITKGPDRIYVQVALNTCEKVLVSHDFGDIPNTVRKRLRKEYGVRILAAEGAVEALREGKPGTDGTLPASGISGGKSNETKAPD